MKNRYKFLLTVLTIVNINANEMPDGVKYIKKLGTELKSQLVSKLKEDKSGKEAILFCAKKASDIEKSVNNKLPKNATVRRTALKLRNQNNVADSLDIKIMEQFKEKLAKKEDISKPIKVKTDNSTRYYKALTIAPACLKCHGENINSDIQKIISEKYPLDKAINFKNGDFRGVVVSEVKSN